MKIEVAESLALSWLRHVRGCKIVQLNWNASRTWEPVASERVAALYAKCHEAFLADGIDLFKKTSSVNQLLRQAEIDALGICLSETKNTVVAVDVAFHEDGLNYGDKSGTTANIIKKLVRTLFVIESYFPNCEPEVLFATPKIHMAQYAPISSAMETLGRFLVENEIKADCRVVANADFFEHMVAPLNKLAKEVADTGELFMRSLQLMAMAPKKL